MYMSNSTLECFLLTAHGRDSGPRYEITLWGAGVLGRRVRILVNDFRPLFFCPRSVPEGETGAAAERKRLPMRSLDSLDVDCLYFNTHGQMQQTARRLRSAGYPVFESDVNPLARYLMERMVSGSMRAEGTPKDAGAFINLTNPRLRGGAFIPELRVLSICIDIDTEENIRRIACVEESHERVFAINNNNSMDIRDDVSNNIISNNSIAGNNNSTDIRDNVSNNITGNNNKNCGETRFCKDERQVLTDFLAHIRERDPDIIIGWRVVDFVLRIIQDRCGKLGVRFEPGREAGCRVAASERRRSWRGSVSSKTVWSARVPGRVVMDVPTMLRAYHHSPDDYQLDFSDCLACAKRVLGVFNEAEILQNAVERSRRSGQTLDTTGGSVASFDYLYLPRLHRAGFVAGDTADIAPPTQALPGGYVIEPAPGLYENVLVFDFKSLYPSIIMTFMIDPLGFRAPDTDRIPTPVGTSFSKTRSILPEIIRELMAARAAAVEQKNPYLSQAIKLMMNSFAGVLGSTGCRFFSEDVSPSITRTGQYILKTSVGHIEKSCGHKVIYGDTDSIFVHLGAGMEEQADALGRSISKETGEWLRGHLMERFGAVSALELKYECHFHRFFLPSLRGGDISQGTKKHYCGASTGKDGSMELTFRGMESARSDWTDLAKEFQRELFIKFFSDQPLEDYVIATAERLQRGDYDQKLVYRKRVRKALDAYTANIPPHVQAAKLLDAPVRLIKYYITKNGPQPVEKLTAPLDYEHYIDSQLRPIADSILEWTGTDFDRLVSGQQDLFGG